MLWRRRGRNGDQHKKSDQLIHFVKDVGKSALSTSGTSLLDEARNWEMSVDLKYQLKFQEAVAQTTL